MSKLQLLKLTVAVLHTATIVLIIFAALLALSVMIDNAHGHDLPPHKSVPGVTHRPDMVDGTADYKHGPIINDLMNRIPTPAPIYKTLKARLVDRRDPANWVHEATHFLNRVYTNVCRQQSGVHCWANYTLNGYGTAFRTPKVTLKQIAAFYADNQKGDFYNSYLVEARAHYNADPLFLIDECVAVGNTMVYVCSTGQRDNYRAAQLVKAAIATSYFLSAVQKHDPEWPDLERFKEWSNWHNQRLVHLYTHYHDIDRPWK
jgi:hypothetical protein